MMSELDTDGVRERLGTIAASMFLLSGHWSGRRQRKLVVMHSEEHGGMVVPDGSKIFASGRHPWVVAERRDDARELAPMVGAIEWLRRERGIDWIKVREPILGIGDGFVAFVSRRGGRGSVRFRLRIGEREREEVFDAVWRGRREMTPTMEMKAMGWKCYKRERMHLLDVHPETATEMAT